MDIGSFVLVVSLLGDYSDNQYVGNFVSCDVAMSYYKEQCQEFKAASCLLEEYMYLPEGHKSRSPFDFKITEPQSCGFVGVSTNQFITN
tara:strand:+ start:5611 stop:5877 length:267 start_codon:yes stop_codon:yes gene_type:complete